MGEKNYIKTERILKTRQNGDEMNTLKLIKTTGFRFKRL